jgi:tRNA1Val (adenine37-N6)-methyltransferase
VSGSRVPDPVSVQGDEVAETFLRGRLRILQKKRGYRFSLDPVLLAARVALKRGDRVIDLGTGSGIIPLLLAARHETGAIVGLEIQERYADMARRSVALGGLAERIEIRRGDVRDARIEFGPESFDVATCNPPFRPVGTGKVNPSDEKAIARHEVAGTLSDFVAAMRYLLRQRGRAHLVVPAARLVDLLAILRGARLEPSRLRTVHPRPGSRAELALVEAVKGGKPGLTVEAPLVVNGDGEGYSDEVAAILSGDRP